MPQSSPSPEPAGPSSGIYRRTYNASGAGHHHRRARAGGQVCVFYLQCSAQSVLSENGMPLLVGGVMGAVAFDTLKLARKLRDSAQMSQDQAEGVADALAEAMSGAELATKSDVVTAKTELKADLLEAEHRLDAKIAGVKAELKDDIASLRGELKGDIAAVKGELAVVKGDIGRLEERIERRAAESDAKTQAVKNELIRWLLGIGIAAIITITGTGWTIIRYLPPHL